MSQAKRKTEPTKRKCAECRGDLPNSDSAPPIRSVTNEIICPNCKINELKELYIASLR